MVRCYDENWYNEMMTRVSCLRDELTQQRARFSGTRVAKLEAQLIPRQALRYGDPVVTTFDYNLCQLSLIEHKIELLHTGYTSAPEIEHDLEDFLIFLQKQLQGRIPEHAMYEYPSQRSK